MAEAIVRGQQGTQVEHLQRLLARAGQRMVVDGVFGPRTQAAVAAYLREHGRSGTGASVDPELLAELERATTRGVSARAPAADASASASTSASTSASAPITAASTSSHADDMGVQAEAQAFARLICSRRTNAPLSIGLFGDQGSGKSFFMGKLFGEIEARCAAFTRVGTALTASADDAGLLALQQRWHGRVAQITFNAWHYAEPNLWASLVTRVFDELADIISPSESLEDTRARLLAEASEGKQRREQAKLELRRAEAQLAEARAERERREAELAELRKQLGVVEAVAPKSDLAQEDAAARLTVRGPLAALRVTLRWVWSRGRWTRVAVIVGAVLVVLGAVLAVAWWRNWWASWLTPGIALATSGVGMCTGIASTIGAWWFLIQPRIMQARMAHAMYLEKRATADGFIERAAGDLLGPAVEPLAVARRRMEEAEVGVDSAKMATDQASEQMANARRMLQELRGGQRFYAFVRDRDEGDDYRRHLGLVSMVRDDFERLEQILDQVERDGPDDGELAPLSRIVLYIDDLDRCEPARVVEVLQALDLLLATSIFVVVVAADVRWLRRSLALHFDHLLHTHGPGVEWGEADSSNPTPRGRLENSFQIPFSLRPFDAEGFASVVQVAARPVMQPDAAAPTTAVAPAALEADLAHDEALTLEPAEVAFIERLYAVVSAPRLLQAVLACYRLLRVELRAELLASFVADEHYRGVLTLLAIQVGRADDAVPLFAALRGAPTTTLGELLQTLGRDSGSDLREARWRALASAVELAGVSELPAAELAPWTDRVQRFSLDPRPVDLQI